MHTESVHLAVDVVPDLATISTTQRVVDDLTCRVLRDTDAGWRLAMAAHELLDNARKYGSEDMARLELAIEAEPGGLSACLAVRSRGTPDQVDAIERIVSNILASPDAWAFYLAAMDRAGQLDQGSGIGLARIRAEGDMALAISVDDEGYVRIEARLSVGGPK